jgi:hypothetical protein
MSSSWISSKVDATKFFGSGQFVHSKMQHVK